jgi:fatty acid desaturase
MEESRLGFVTMIAVLLTDVFIYLIYNSQITKTSTLICLAALLNRLLLYCFGGNYWIYGYMVLYLIYGAILSYVITEKRFPFENAFDNINLNNIHQRSASSDISKAPEFLLVFITTIYVILFVILYVTEPRGVPLMRLTIS